MGGSAVRRRFTSELVPRVSVLFRHCFGQLRDLIPFRLFIILSKLVQGGVLILPPPLLNIFLYTTNYSSLLVPVTGPSENELVAVRRVTAQAVHNFVNCRRTPSIQEYCATLAKLSVPTVVLSINTSERQVLEASDGPVIRVDHTRDPTKVLDHFPAKLKQAPELLLKRVPLALCW
jgi:hypothetical protein